MPRPVIETRGLTKRFRDVEALSGVDLDVPRGGVFGFLGPNGAGKTTTIRILVGLMRQTRGECLLLGQTVQFGAPVLQRVGALVERPAFYPYLTALDNLRVLGLARGMAGAALASRIDEVLDRVAMTSAANRKVGRFSTGMRQRLGIAAALLGRPELVILDEPTAGLDPNGVVDVRRLIAELARDAVTVFLSSHVLHEVEQICDRVAILNAGRIVAHGETKALLQPRATIVVRFDTAADAERARPLLARRGAAPSGDGAQASVIVEAPPEGGSEIIRTLAAAEIFPAELRVDRPSLESLFMELTRGDEA